MLWEDELEREERKQEPNADKLLAAGQKTLADVRQWRAANKKLTNLNRAQTLDSFGGELGLTSLMDRSVDVGPVSVYFRGLVEYMEEFILKSDAIVGCTAWLTHPTILNVLESCQCVSILLNKEDFLRPDSKTVNGRVLQESYERVKGITLRHHTPVAVLCGEGDEAEAGPFRCVGMAGRSQRPRLHHKFLVRLTRGYRRWEWIPTAVWTGSFNPTHGGEASLENAVVIRNRKLADAFYWEWGQALAISEPLDWKSPWVAPEYRVRHYQTTT